MSFKSCCPRSVSSEENPGKPSQAGSHQHQGNLYMGERAAWHTEAEWKG